MKGCRALGQVYSHLSEEERRIIRIEIGNGTSIRRIAGLIGRHASTVSRGIKRNTWFPSNENESYRPYRPERLKTGPWTGRCHISGPAHRKAGRRRARTGVTHDNGTEFARHAELRERLGMATYFTAPYPSCRRGGNENRNGAIRRYLPKRTRVDPSMADGDTGHRGRDQRPSHARARLPHPGRGIRRRTAIINRTTRMLHF